MDDCEELDKEFLQIFSELSKQGASPSYVRQIAFLIYSEINAKIGHNNDDYQGYVMRINNSENLQDIINILKEVLEKVSVGDPLNKDYSENIRRVIEIIKKNYQDDLNLRYVSDCLHLNSDYLGQLFKKELKMSFSKYLNEYRIEQAQYLLKETKQSVSEISSKVGYMTTAYFYRNFKIICGISPKEYRKKYV